MLKNWKVKITVGEVQEMIHYYVGTNHGLIRMKGSIGIQDIVVYFDQEGNVTVIFEHSFHKIDQGLEIIAYLIGNNSFYIDGLPYGELSCLLTAKDSLLIIE